MNPIVVNNDEQNLSCPIKLRAHLHANTRIDDSAFLPPVTSDDDGKILTVIDGKWSLGYSTIKEYEGPYDVIPIFKNDITLKTFGKLMSKDVSVKKIPQQRAENAAGGITLILGGVDEDIDWSN